jgi:hypothetical protein
MLIWFTLALYPAPLLLVATLFSRRVSLFIMLLTQFILLIGPFIRSLLGQVPFSGFENSLLALIVWVFAGLLLGWPIAERFRVLIDRRRETITNTIILSQAFNSALFAVIITMLINLCWQSLPVGWPIYSGLVGNWFGVSNTIILLAICLAVGLIKLPKYLNSTLYRR